MFDAIRILLCATLGDSSFSPSVCLNINILSHSVSVAAMLGVL